MIKNVFRSFILLLLLLLNIYPLEGQKQNLISKIKQNDSYQWGEAISKNRTEARQQAEVNLLSKIQVSINSQFMDIIREKREGDSSTVYSETESQVSNYTGMYLKGLNRKYKQTGEKWTVLAYIHQDSLKKSFDYRKEKILHYARNGISAARRGNLENGLKYLYWGYLLSRNYPYKIKIVCLTGGKSRRPQMAFQYAVSSIFDNMKLTSEDCYKDGSVIMAPLKCTHKDKPIKKAYFSYYSGVGTDYAVIENGKIDIPIYDDPVNDSRKLTLNFEYEYVNEMGIDPEVKALHKFYKDANFVNQKTVTITFPWNQTSNEKDKKEDKEDIEKEQSIAEDTSKSRNFDIAIKDSTNKKAPKSKNDTLVSVIKNDSNKVKKDTTKIDTVETVNQFEDSTKQKIDTLVENTEKDTVYRNNDTIVKDTTEKESKDSTSIAKKDSTSHLKPETEAIKVLFQNTDNIRRFLQLLAQYKKLGELQFGNREDLNSIEKSYVTILDKKSISTILYFNGNKYIDINSKKEYNTLNTNFKGMHLIWIKELK